MATEVMPWQWAEAIRTERELALFLAVLLEEKDDEGPTVYAAAIAVAVQVRGGLLNLARESGIAEPELQAAMDGTEAQALPVIQRLAGAYRQFLPSQLVA